MGLSTFGKFSVNKQKKEQETTQIKRKQDNHIRMGKTPLQFSANLINIKLNSKEQYLFLLLIFLFRTAACPEQGGQGIPDFLLDRRIL
jgi:hypothetical protein